MLLEASCTRCLPRVVKKQLENNIVIITRRNNNIIKE